MDDMLTMVQMVLGIQIMVMGSVSDVLAMEVFLVLRCSMMFGTRACKQYLKRKG